MSTEWASQFYRTNAWDRCRVAYRSYRRGLCERCLKRGIVTPGTEVHHIIPLTPKNINNPNITLSWKNLMLLCTSCHDEVHAEMQKKQRKSHVRFEVGKDGEIIPRRNDRREALVDPMESRRDPPLKKEEASSPPYPPVEE